MKEKKDLFRYFSLISTFIIKLEHSDFIEYICKIDDYTLAPEKFTASELVKTGSYFLLEFQNQYLFKTA